MMNQLNTKGNDWTAADVRFHLLGFSTINSRKKALEILNETGQLEAVLNAGGKQA